MSYGQVDFVDLLAYPLFLFGGLLNLGIMDGVDLAGWDPAGTLVMLPGSTELTFATLLCLIALGVVIATNRPDVSGRGGLQLWVVVATFGLVLGPPFIPMLDALLGGGVASVVAFLIQTGGYMVLSWLG